MELSSLSEADTTSKKGKMQNIASTVSVKYPMIDSTSRSVLARLRTFGVWIFAVVELIGLPPFPRIKHDLYRICVLRNWRA